MRTGVRAWVLLGLFLALACGGLADGQAPGQKTGAGGALTPANPLASAAISKLPPGTLSPVLLAFDPTGTSSLRRVALDRGSSSGLVGGRTPGQKADGGNPGAKALADALGVIAPAQLVRVTPKVAGHVTEVLVAEGAQVKAGQVLARLDRTVYELEYKRAQAAVDRAQARLAATQAELGTHQAEIRQAEAGVQEAAAQRDFSKRKMERTQALFKNQAVDEQILFEAGSQFQAVEARLRQADATLKVRQQAPQRERVAAARADVASAEAQRDLARYRLENTDVRAPAAGTVLSSSVEVGDSVGSAWANGRAASLFEIADLAHLEAVVDLPDRTVQRVTKGLSCEIRLDALPQRVYRGQVWRIAPTVSRNDRTVAVRIKLDVPKNDGRLRPGMSGLVRILPNE